MLLQSNNLSSLEQTKLRKLLDDDAWNILFKVLESRAMEHEVAAANHLLEERTGHDLAAKEEIRNATSIHSGVTALKAIREQEKFTVVTAVPNTKTTTKTTS